MAEPPRQSQSHRPDQAAEQGVFGLSRVDWLIIVLGAAVLLANLFAARPLLSANDRSRWATVWSLVERGTYQIDAIDRVPAWTTIDKVQHEGHLYSSKPPLLSTLAAGVYWFWKQVAGLDLFSQTDDTTHLVLMVLNWLPTVAGFIVFARLLHMLDVSPAASVVALATMCFGTLVTGYATTLNNHSAAAVCLIFTISPLLRIANHDRASAYDFAAAGFWAALVCCFELPAALLGVVAFLLAARCSIRQTICWFVPASIIPLAAYFVTNAIATGSWQPFYAHYGTEKYLFTVDGVPSYWMHPRGLDRNLDTPLVYLLHCTIGHHGIFSLTPIVLLALVAWCRRSLWRRSSLEPAVWLALGLTVAVLGFYLTRTENYNYGGNTFGLRWIIWLSPLWIVSLLPALELLLPRLGGRMLVWTLLGASVYSAQLAARNPWSESWLFHHMTQAGWIDYSDPPPKLPFDRALHTWFSDLPGEAHVGGWIEFASRSASPAGLSTDVLRISDAGLHEVSGRLVREIEFRWNADRPDAQTLRVRVDIEQFYSGASIDTSLIEVSGKPVRSRSEVLSFLRGIPVAREYRPGPVRYLKTPLRKEAFRCHRAAVQVAPSQPATGRPVVDRCDTWLCPDVPFGVLQFELSETDDRREEIFKRRFTAVRVSAVKPADSSLNTGL